MERVFHVIIDLSIILSTTLVVFIINYFFIAYIKKNFKKSNKRKVAWIEIFLGIISLFIKNYNTQIGTFYNTILIAVSFSAISSGFDLFKNIKASK